MKRRLLLGLLLLSLTISSFAVIPDINIGSVATDNYPRLKAFCSIYDMDVPNPIRAVNTPAVTGLTPSDVVVWEDGTMQTVTSVVFSSAPSSGGGAGAKKASFLSEYLTDDDE
jgi:hypothetical protein